jgi:hypothetical protein
MDGDIAWAASPTNTVRPRNASGWSTSTIGLPYACPAWLSSSLIGWPKSSK